MCFFTGGQCGCSNYSTLLYALSSAVVILILLLALLFVVFYKVSGPRIVTRCSRPMRGEGGGSLHVAEKQQHIEGASL